MGSIVSRAANTGSGKRARSEEPEMRTSKVRKLDHSTDVWESRLYNDTIDAAENSDHPFMMPIAEHTKLQSHPFAVPSSEDVDIETVTSPQKVSKSCSANTEKNGSQHKSIVKAQSLDTVQPVSKLELNDAFPDIFEDMLFLHAPSLDSSGRSSISSPASFESTCFHSPPESFREPEDLALGDNAYASKDTNLPVESSGFVDPRAFFDPYREDIEVTAIDHSKLNAPGLAKLPETSDDIRNEHESPSLAERVGVEDFHLVECAPALDMPTPSIAKDSPSTVAQRLVPVVELRLVGFTFPTQTIPESVPISLGAERLVLGNVEYLTHWRDGARESWVAEAEILRIAPHLVNKWKASTPSDIEETPVLDNIVEKILSKKKVKGIPHYLVKWQGYPEAKDRTWEPCDRLRVDVPILVDTFELGLATKKKKKR